jgi:hypothetical protein
MGIFIIHLKQIKPMKTLLDLPFEGNNVDIDEQSNI